MATSGSHTRSSEPVYLERLFTDPPVKQKLTQCGPATDSPSRLLLNQLCPSIPLSLSPSPFSTLSAGTYRSAQYAVYLNREETSEEEAPAQFNKQESSRVIDGIFFPRQILLTALMTLVQPPSSSAPLSPGTNRKTNSNGVSAENETCNPIL